MKRQLSLLREMSNILKKIFKRKTGNYWNNDMLTIPCPEEMFVSTELSSGFGRRLPCYDTDQCVIIVKEENGSRGKAEITDERKEGLSTELLEHSQHSVQPGSESKGKQKLRLEELKKKAPPGYKQFEFEAALRSLDVDEETALELWEDLFSKL